MWRGMAGGGSSAVGQSTAEEVNGCEDVPVREWRNGGAGELHSSSVKLARGLWGSGWCCSGGLTVAGVRRS